MNKQIGFLILLISVCAYADGPVECQDLAEYDRTIPSERKNNAIVQRVLAEKEEACERARANAPADKRQAQARSKEQAAAITASDKSGISDPTQCKSYIDEIDNKAREAGEPTAKQAAEQRKKSPTYLQCRHLRTLSKLVDETLEIQTYTRGKFELSSMDQKIKCVKTVSVTYDYEGCAKALAAYNFIINSESFMNLQQTVRTDLKNANINKKANAEAANGDAQTAMFGAAEESNKHMKSLEAEKAAAYTAAVGALGNALYRIPNEEEVVEACKEATQFDPGITGNIQQNCQKMVSDHKTTILANQRIKGALFEAIAQFTAKGIAAGIKMKQYGNNAQAIAKAKAPIYDEGTDMMIELCTANPTDPACITPGNRVSNSGTFGQGDFSLGGDGANNVFGSTPEGSEFGEIGADTTIDDKNQVAGINSPFKDEAKTAKGILDPAAAAQTQGGAPNTPAAAGGAAGAGGASGASLGSDLAGADPDADKEAQIKAGKVSGSYNMAGGGGYKGIAKGKDDTNPFASLFDQKGGGVEEDRSIASGDIDGKSLGLFEKISKRYGQVQADKRVEAKNLE